MTYYKNQSKNIFTHQITQNFYRYILFVILIAGSLLLVGCFGDTNAENSDPVSAQKIIENPDAYVGKTVTVTGDVEEIYGPKAFNLDSGLNVGELLVIGREPFPNIPGSTDNIYLVNNSATVTGTVRLFIVADIEREIGWDLTPEIEAEYAGKPVLIAQQAQFQPAAGQTAADAAGDKSTGGSDGSNADTVVGDVEKDSEANRGLDDMAEADGINNSGNRTSAEIIDLNAYVKLPENDRLSLAGKSADFQGVRVNRIVGPKTFTVGSGSNELYVMLDDDAVKAVGTQGKIDIGDRVNLSGEFERLKAEEIANTADTRFRQLTAQERQFMKDKKIYLDVNKINILN